MTPNGTSFSRHFSKRFVASEKLLGSEDAYEKKITDHGDLESSIHYVKEASLGKRTAYTAQYNRYRLSISYKNWLECLGYAAWKPDSLEMEQFTFGHLNITYEVNEDFKKHYN